MEVYKVDVFTKEPLKGNPAAVVLDSKLDDEKMLKLAFELNMSETVFVEEKDCSKFRLRFFTPSCEVSFCGHATIAAFYVLRDRDKVKGHCKAITNSGIVDVIVEDKVWFKSNPKILESVKFGFEEFNILAIVDVGIKIGLVEVKSFKNLIELKPDFDKLAEFCKRKDLAGIHVFTFDSNSDASVRFFAPAVGIPEDPVTGTANSALAYYLKESGKLVKEEYVFEQGHVLGRLGFVHVKISDGVWVGGDAVCILRGILNIYF